MEDNKIVIVTNRNKGFTGYEIPDTGVKRTFAPGESKKLAFEEISQLQSTPGGDYLLRHLLIVNDTGALEDLNLGNVEPEYFYTEKEIKELLETGSLDQLEDTLNFAPDGVIELIKDMAVQTKIPDVRKRQMISEKTGLNIDTAIRINEVMAADVAPAAEPEKKVRKAAPIAVEESAPARKTSAPKYKVIG